MSIRQLSLTDASFLYAESGNCPMHIAGLQLLEVPIERRNGFFASLKRYYAERLHQVPFLTQRVVAMPMGIDHPVWESCEVEIDYHIRHLALPAPGSMQQLEELIARLHARPLDRSRPLWEYYLIEGVEGSRVAWYTKMHHAAIDGMAGQALMELLYNETPEDAPIRTAAAAPPPANPMQRLNTALLALALEPIKMLGRSLDQWVGATNLMTRLMRGQSFGAYLQNAPATRLNVTVGPNRAYAVGTLLLSDLKTFGKTQGATINDVFMALCAGALRRYLGELGQNLDQPLIAGAPVSLREPGDQSMNNQVSMMLYSLETHIEDPIQRLRAIAKSAKTAKEVLPMTKDLAVADMHIAGLPVAFASAAALTSALPAGMPVPSPINVVISNVPGPRVTKYLHGARMLTHYPVSIAAPGNALNFTVQSYVDRLDFSLTACRDAVPDITRLRDFVLDAWQELKNIDRSVDMPQIAAPQRKAA